MTRAVRVRPNGSPSDKDFEQFSLPGRAPVYRVEFYLGKPFHVTSQFTRSGDRLDYLGRRKGGWSSCVTKTLWGSWTDEEPGKLAKLVIAEALRRRAERFPVVERAARMLEA